MKIIILLLVFSPISSFADISDYNGQYQVTYYDWCGRPHNKKTPGNCSQQGWGSVDVDSIKSFVLDFHRSKQFIKFVDVFGNSWHKDLRTCNSSSRTGCSASIEPMDEGSYTIRLKEWDRSRRYEAEMLFQVTKFDEFFIYSPDNALIVFDVEKVK